MSERFDFFFFYNLKNTETRSWTGRDIGGANLDLCFWKSFFEGDLRSVELEPGGEVTVWRFVLIFYYDDDDGEKKAQSQGV